MAAVTARSPKRVGLRRLIRGAGMVMVSIFDRLQASYLSHLDRRVIFANHIEIGPQTKAICAGAQKKGVELLHSSNLG